MKTLDALLPPNAGERKTLADMIFSKLEESEAKNPSIALPHRQGKELNSPGCISLLNCHKTVKLLIQQQA